MEKPTYSVKVSDDGFSYFFDSISESQTIKKAELYYQVFGIFADGSIEIFNPTHQYFAFLITQKDDKYS